ncbi:hypothetical protein [Deinococcus arenicola]|uniref:Right handed beta helix domain-containing protein n=1 Tax=Deinococcus arenicola TaxID=2994950 RepID=A0ABU4DU98_9DEIO|nr:hypothetical protein [Deinococcus sp. ZS9-10]MDV6376011.1 hypothetical protein [Deinococcus sp. ZS9-10]
MSVSASQAQTIRYDKPIVINKGGTYRGNWQSLDPKVPAVTVATGQKVIIEKSNIQSKGTLIYTAFKDANLTVRNTRGVALNPDRPLKEYQYPGRFVHAEEFKNIVLENNELTGTSGIYLRDYRGKISLGETIKILRNKVRNIDGRYSTGVGQYSDKEFRLVQFVQFNAVRGISGAEIAWNEVINEPGKSRPEENINMYVSSGLPESRIKIHDNYIQGAYAVNARGNTYAGGGINAGDGSAKTLATAAGHILVYGNQIVGTSNNGIAISAGHNIEVYYNRVISSGYLPSGVPISSQNVGLYVWDMNNDKAKKTFFGNSMHDNLVGWARPLQGKSAQNATWFPDCQPGKCLNNRSPQGRVTQTMEREEYTRWRTKLKGAKITVGPVAK